MKINRFPLFVLILFLPIYPAFAWQVIPYEEKTVSTKQEDRVVFNLVFMPLNYEEKNEFQKDVSSINDTLRKTVPFDEFRGLKVYLLEISPKEEAILFKKAEGFPFLKIRDDFIKQLRVRLDSPYKLIILDKKGSVSAAELSDINKISIVILNKDSYDDKNKLARTFLHEIGHSLGLREENPHSGHPIIPGPPNCAPDKESAVGWWGDMVGKIADVNYMGIRCGENKFIKPTYRSIMNNPFKSDTYGPVNERYLRKGLGLEQ